MEEREALMRGSCCCRTKEAGVEGSEEEVRLVLRQQSLKEVGATRHRMRSTNRMTQHTLVESFAFREHLKLHRSFRLKRSNRAPQSRERIVIVQEEGRVGMEVPT